MKLWFQFKDKFKAALELSNLNKKKNPALDQATKSSNSLSSRRSIPELYKEKEHNLRAFTFEELRKATNGFSRLMLIGEGGFGSVYKGTIRPANGQGNPTVVAIKKINQHGLQGHKQWLAEVQFLGVFSHPNIVKLIGYCSVDGESWIQRLLVYEFMPNRSLEDHLFNRALPTLPWMKRLQIILGAAQGMAYLHEGAEVMVIHRDFKSSNVLLDEKFQAKLSDFGLAREGPAGDNTHVSTAVVGTFGYAAPEYFETGRLTAKSDLWSFGVVLYEILTGRRALERIGPMMEQRLLDWVRRFPVDSERFSKIIDPRLGIEFSPIAARKIAKLADSCLIKKARDRPTMSQVVARLKEAIEDSEKWELEDSEK
ncbi:hypothetical protein UlMin_001444 [Ulmus minor]